MFQGDILMECCRFGPIHSVVLLEPHSLDLAGLHMKTTVTTTAATTSTSTDVELIYNDLFVAGSGTAVVTFNLLESAVACFGVMNGRRLDGRRLQALVLDPTRCQSALSDFKHQVGAGVGETVPLSVPAPAARAAPAPTVAAAGGHNDTMTSPAANFHQQEQQEEEEEQQQQQQQQEDDSAADIDDFLNSLL